MENAARGAAETLLRLESWPLGEVLCLAGPGNNGGDAMAVARHLALAGCRVVVGILTSRRDPEGGTDWSIQRRITRSMGLPHVEMDPDSVAKKVPEMLGSASAVVDGFFGTGLDRPVRGGPADAIMAVNASGIPVLALDLPSGLDCDTGEPLGATIRARHTATFVAPKLGFDNPASRTWTGSVTVVGIGAPLIWPLEA